MMKKLIYLIPVLVFVACSDAENDQSLEGTWKAHWNADPGSFPGVDGSTHFQMNGQFIFQEDSLTVIAQGYPGCIFGEDTISHTQLWEIRSDSLQLISEPGVLGISYLIEQKSKDTIELKLMDDISVSLVRSQREEILDR